MNKKLVIIGASGHGKVVADIAKKNGYESIVFLDDNENLTMCGSYRVVGKSSNAKNYNCDMIVAIGNANIRKKIQERLEFDGQRVISLIHPKATIGEDVLIGAGTVVMAGTVVNSGSVIGKGCIINTSSSVDHDCKVSNYAHISVGAHLAGTVTVGECAWIGIGAVVSNNLKIARDSMIGAGAVVVHDICESGTYVGVPARMVK